MRGKGFLPVLVTGWYYRKFSRALPLRFHTEHKGCYLLICSYLPSPYSLRLSLA